MASSEKKMKNAVSRIPCLVQIYGACVNQRYRLLTPMVLIGRHPKSAIRLNSINVSRNHCTLRYSNGKWTVKDNDSQNGTFVNCKRLEKGRDHHLQMGDIIYLGPPSESPIAFAFDDFIEEELDTVNTINVKDVPASDKSVEFIEDECSSSKSACKKQIVDSIKKTTNKDIQVEEISQSLLDAESSGVLSQDPYPFSMRLDGPFSGNNSLVKVEASSSPKSGDSSQISDSESLKTKLARLSEEIKALEKSKFTLLQDYEAMCEKNRLLDQKLTEQQKSKEDELMNELRIKNQFKTQIMEKLEEDLICNICTEVLIKPTVLDCSHTFCEHCITQWKKTKAQCPICRSSIKSQTRVLALDHFIDKTLETLTPDQKEKRNQLVLEREQLKNKPKQLPFMTRGRRGRRISRRREAMISRNIRIPVPHTPPTVPSVSDIRRNIEISLQGLYQTPIVQIIDITDTPRAVQRPLLPSARALPVPDILLSSDSDDASEGPFTNPCYNCGSYAHAPHECSG